jgi:type I pantothenate kinase
LLRRFAPRNDGVPAVHGCEGGLTEPTAYLSFDRAQWAALRAATPLTLSRDDLRVLRSINEDVSLNEVVEAYLPLSRLLNLHVSAARNLASVKDAFLGRPAGHTPYIIAIAGSVAVGKSTFARILKALIERWPDRPKVELVTTDGFLHPNAVLDERGLMTRKGFPESYDMRRMIRFLTDVKSGEPEVVAPLYSHVAYDIVPGETQIVSRPDVLIFEGLNVLQLGATPVLASDFFDFSVYVDANEVDIESWYLERFLLLQKTAFQDSAGFFHRYKDLEPEAAIAFAREVWRSINLANLHENILPTRERATLILSKRADHTLGEVRLRRM